MIKSASNTSIKRDMYFWKDIQEFCKAYQEMLTDSMLPILNQIGLTEYDGKAIRININSENMLQSMYPLIEVYIFSSAVTIAALYDYIEDFNDEDNHNLKKYILSDVYEFVSKSLASDGENQTIYRKRVAEYYLACKSNLLCGYSTYKLLGLSSEGLKEWTDDHKTKCIQLLCDYLAYLKCFKKPASVNELKQLNLLQYAYKDINEVFDVCDGIQSIAGAIFLSVKELLDGTTRRERREKGLCQYCGSEFKKTLFSRTCPICNLKKDY